MDVRRIYKLLAACALGGVALASLVLTLSIQSVWAQGGAEIYVDKQLGRPEPVVHVGEYITFTILVENRASFTITQLPLSDVYNTAVLRFVDAVPPPDNVAEAVGQLEWADLTYSFGPIPPGQRLIVTVGFVAEHPESAIVNAAKVHDALGSGGALSGTNSLVTDVVSIGGSSPVDKELLAGLIPRAGLPLTFTVRITNDGYTTLTVVPLVDHYDPSLLQFSRAVPPPDLVDEADGTLNWTDLTVWTGDISAHGTITVMTVFTALRTVDLTANGARVEGARDWYDNDLAGGYDEVPITIIQGPASPTNTPQPPAPTQQPPPAPTQQPPPAATVTPWLPTPTATPLVLLPESGQAGGLLWLVTALVALVGGGVACVARGRR